MKPIFAKIALAILSVSPMPSSSQELNRDLSAKDLLSICDDNHRQLVCSSYIAGILNGIDYMNTKQRVDHNLSGGFCLISKHPSEQEIQEVVIDFIRKYSGSKMYNMSASVAAYMSLISAYPCKEHDTF